MGFDVRKPLRLVKLILVCIATETSWNIAILCVASLAIGQSLHDTIFVVHRNGPCYKQIVL